MSRLRALVTVMFVVGASVVGLSPRAATAAPPGDLYSYLENPGMVAEGQEPAHAYLRPYADVDSAVRRDEDSPFTRSLDGKWRIAMAKRPEEVPAGFHADGYDTSGWREVSVPHTWQTDGLDHPIF